MQVQVRGLSSTYSYDIEKEKKALESGHANANSKFLCASRRSGWRKKRRPKSAGRRKCVCVRSQQPFVCNQRREGWQLSGGPRYYVKHNGHRRSRSSKQGGKCGLKSEDVAGSPAMLPRRGDQAVQLPAWQPRPTRAAPHQAPQAPHPAEPVGHLRRPIKKPSGAFCRRS